MGTLCVWICACVVGVNICITVYLTSHIIACIGFTHTLLTKIKKCSILYWFLQASITRYSGWQIAFTLWGKPFIFWMTCTAEYLVLYAFQKHATAEQSNVHQDIPHYGTEPPFKWHQQQDVFMCNIQWKQLNLIHFSQRLSVESVSVSSFECVSVFFPPWQKMVMEETPYLWKTVEPLYYNIVKCPCNKRVVLIGNNSCTAN